MKKIFQQIFNLFLLTAFLTGTQNCTKKSKELSPVTPTPPQQSEEIKPGTTVGFGAILLSTDEYTKLPAIQDPQIGARTLKDPALPASYDLSPKMPPVDNQGPQGSCVAWSVAYAARSYWNSTSKNLSYLGTDGKRNDENVFSPAFIYNQINKGVDNGSRVDQALQLLANAGVCSWKDMPYNPLDFKTQPTTTQKQKALAFKIKKWGRINNNETTFKRFLYFDYPVIITALLDENFNQLKEKDANGEYIWKTSSGGNDGHAMVIVGYDDAKKAFKVQNSWSDKWANKGFIWLAYELVPKVIKEAYIIVSGEVNPKLVRPVLLTEESGDLTAKEVEMRGKIETLGDSPVIKYGFCISLTNPNPTDQIEVKNNPIKTLPHSFSSKSAITSAAGTKVYYRSFAETTDSLYYGNTVAKTIPADTQNPIASNGTLLFGVTAFDAKTGKMKWRSYDIDNLYRGSIYKNTFFIPFSKSRSFGINAINMSDGSIKWKYTAASPVYGIPTFAGDVIYVTTENSVLALNSNTGALKWEYKAGSVTDWLLRGCTVQNNFVYVPYTAGQNTKDSAPKTDILDANTGKKIRTLDGKVEINPSVLDDIVFLSRSNSNKCQGVSAYTTSTGNKVWENCALPIAIGNPIKIISNSLYHYAQSNSPSNHSIIAADSKTGQLKWKIEFNNSSSSTPSLVSFDEKYFAYTIRSFTSGNVSSGKTTLRIHNLSDGSLMWEKEIKKGQFADTPVPLVVGETIYVDSETSTGHNLTAYDVKTGNTIWVVDESAGGGSFRYPMLISNNGIIYQGAASPF